MAQGTGQRQAQAARELVAGLKCAVCDQERRILVTLDDMIRLVVDSDFSDWLVLAVHSDNENGHDYRAVFKKDPSISVEWGAGRADFEEAWTNEFVGREAATERAEVFLNGSLVFRETYVSVDASKGILPMPRMSDRTVPARRLRFAGLLQSLSDKNADGWRFGQYVQLAGIKETDEPWPQL
jgi:hypothetical protein